MSELRDKLLSLPVPGPPAAAAALLALLRQRRSVRHLTTGPFDELILGRVLAAARLTPAAYGRPAWRLVVIRERQIAFWSLVEECFRATLPPERLARNLTRLAGFRGGVGAIVVYEDLAVRAELVRDCALDAATAQSFAEQGLGVVQLALWLALTAEGLTTSLQHWDALLAEELAAFLDLAPARFRLVSIMPLGYTDEVLPAGTRRPLDTLVGRESGRGFALRSAEGHE